MRRHLLVFLAFSACEGVGTLPVIDGGGPVGGGPVGGGPVGGGPVGGGTVGGGTVGGGTVGGGTVGGGTVGGGTVGGGTVGGGTVGGGTVGGGTAGAGGALDAGSREVLIAQGRLGRTMLSCDDGRSWVNDRDEAAGAQCGDPPLVECFHHPWASMGLVHTGSSVVATWGWGAPGRVRRTLDGVTWEDVVTGTSFGAIAASPQVVIGAARPPLLSRLDGQHNTWTAGGDLRSGSVTRHAAYVPANGGRFFIVLDDALKASDDLGASWSTVSLPSSCLQAVRAVVAHDATIILARWSGSLCTSLDRGQTWSERQVASGFTSNGVFAQNAFHLWNGATRYRSVDGLTWTAAQSTPSDVAIGAVTVTSAGTFVAFKGGWQSDYAFERIYRSADGVTWQVVPSSAHAHSHPITHLIAGPLRASTVCP